MLNRNFEIVDKIKQTVFQNEQYNGKDLGTATIFQDDVRISTNVSNADGSRAIGTRAAEDVYNQVVKEGQPWIGRAFVVNDWYITSYEPIRNLRNDIIGMLYVGVLEQKYTDISTQTVVVFLTITLVGVLVASALSYYISRRISGAIRQLVTASEAIMHGKLEARADVRSRDELRDLASAFNAMASALQHRDEQVKQFTVRKIMESERLALIGQLAANVAHELNNPLQGIVTYSRLLLERIPSDDPSRPFIQKIVSQADRSRNIIRGLLDFSRQRTPNRLPSDVNQVLQECVALVEDQALFHNIELVKDLHDGLPPVIIDPAQIQQVFMNIMINSAQGDGGRRAIDPVNPRPVRRATRPGGFHRHRPRDHRREHRTHLRSVLHHQGDRPWRRARTGDQLRHHQRAPGNDLGAERGGQGHHLYHPIAGGGRGRDWKIRYSSLTTRRSCWIPAR